jgi:hypothetical protein
MKSVPTFEPEVITASIAKAHGDMDKVATTGIKVMVVDGVEISSRYNKAHEMEAMREMIQTLPREVSRIIRRFWCNSKAGNTYTVTIDDRYPRNIAMAIGHALEEASGGHNGIWIENSKRQLGVIEPNWFED